MSMFDQAAKLASSPSAMPQSGDAYPEPPREMHLKERVMTHEQHIKLLQAENAEIRQALGDLAAACRVQLGLEI